MTARIPLLRFLPGLLLAAAVMAAAGWLAGPLGAAVLRLQGIPPEGRPSPVSAIMLAIVVGMLVANVVRLPAAFAPGITTGARHVLRAGIILVGIRLSFLDVLKLGAFGVPVVVVLVAIALLIARRVGRLLGVSDRLATLAAASTAICGVTATLAVAPAIDAEEKEVAYTIANVTLFGLVAMFVYPYCAHALFPNTPGAAGIFLGGAIHETSQVMGAALAYRDVFADEAALRVATVTKLVRNVLLVAVVPVLAYAYARGAGARGPVRRTSLRRLFPGFVLGFLAMAIIRSIGDASMPQGRAFGLWDAAAWKQITALVGERIAPAVLGVAMACVGLGSRLSAFRGLGLRPLYLGAIVATLVGALALVLAALAGPLVPPA